MALCGQNQHIFKNSHSFPAPAVQCAQNLFLPKGDELPIMVEKTGGSGPARVWGHVKSDYSAEETMKGLRV